MPTPPETHFDATFLLKQTKHPKGVKVSQFYDSIEVKAAMGLLEEPIETKIGRGGYTWIHNDLRQLFDQWLSEVGKGRGKRNTLQENGIKSVTIDENKLYQPEDCDCIGFHTGACRTKGDLGIA